MELQTDKLGKVSITVEEGYWDISKDYDKLTVVEKEGVFGTFISRKPVPAGTELTNRNYWIPFSSLKEEILINYNAFLDKYQDQLDSYDKAIEEFRDKTVEVSDNLDKLKEGLEVIDDVKDSVIVLNNHLNNKNNPHNVTKVQLGLENVDNTADIDKPVSKAQQAQITATYNSAYNHTQRHINDKANPHSVTKAQVGLSNVTNDAQIKRSEMGVSSGVATLDTNGKVPSSQLPSYVDDVLEFDNKDSFPTTGETGKIYVDTTANLTYRWGGSQYVEISPSLALGETSSTAYAGDKGAQLKTELNELKNYTIELHNVDINFNNTFRGIRSGYTNALPVVYIDKALDNEYHIHWDIDDAYYAINPINDSKGISKNLLYHILKGTAECESVAFIRGSLPISFRNIDSTRLEALKYVDVVGLVSGGITDGSCSAIAFGKIHDDYKITNYIFRLDITTHVNDIYVVFNHIDLTKVQTLASNTKFGFIRGLNFNDVLLQKYGVRIINGEGHVQVPVADGTHAGLLSKEDKIKLNGIQDNANNYELPTATYTTKGGILLDNPFMVDNNGHLLCKTASETQTGLMTGADKTKLNNISIATSTKAGLIKADLDVNEKPNNVTRCELKLTDSGKAYTYIPHASSGVYGLVCPSSTNYNNNYFGLKISNDGGAYVNIADASTEQKGLMTVSDKQKLDNIRLATNNNYGLIQGYDNTMLDNGYALQITNGLGKVVIPDATVTQKGLMTSNDKQDINYVNKHCRQEISGAENDDTIYDTLKSSVLKIASIRGLGSSGIYPSDSASNSGINFDDVTYFTQPVTFYTNTINIGSINLATWLPTTKSKLDKLPSNFVTNISTIVNTDNNGVHITWYGRSSNQTTDTSYRTTIPLATTSKSGIMSFKDKNKLYYSPFIIDINTCTINAKLTSPTETVGLVTLNTNEDYNADLEKAFEDTDFNHNFIVKGILKTEYIKGSQVSSTDIYVNNIISIGRSTHVCKIVITADDATTNTLYGIVEIKLQDISANHVTFAYNIVDILGTVS